MHIASKAGALIMLSRNLGSLATSPGKWPRVRRTECVITFTTIINKEQNGTIRVRFQGADQVDRKRY